MCSEAGNGEDGQGWGLRLVDQGLRHCSTAKAPLQSGLVTSPLKHMARACCTFRSGPVHDEKYSTILPCVPVKWSPPSPPCNQLLPPAPPTLHTCDHMAAIQLLLTTWTIENFPLPCPPP